MPMPPADLDTLSPAELRRLLAETLLRLARVEEENRQLREEVARLQKLAKKPKLAPGGMDKATAAGAGKESKQRGAGAGQAAERQADPAGDGAADPFGHAAAGFAPARVRELRGAGLGAGPEGDRVPA
jgi:hypothetical protein